MKKASVPVAITIRDNQPPQFNSPTYNSSFVEGVSLGHLVTTVTAQDPDGDAITYSIKVRGLTK